MNTGMSSNYIVIKVIFVNVMRSEIGRYTTSAITKTRVMKSSQELEHLTYEYHIRVK